MGRAMRALSGGRPISHVPPPLASPLLASIKALLCHTIYLYFNIYGRSWAFFGGQTLTRIMVHFNYHESDLIGKSITVLNPNNM